MARRLVSRGGPAASSRRSSILRGAFWTHHLEVHGSGDIDSDVVAGLREV
jgi:hypothetical protein